MSGRDLEPVVGWRLWRVREDELCSWAVEHVWPPGENNAACLSDGLFRCLQAPGPSCRCGFWALNSPVSAIRLASAKPAARAVLGLITAFGTVAVHGREGFRAEVASVACLFSDEIALPPAERLWRSLRRRLFRRADDELIPRRTDSLKSLAARYSVPVVSLQSAISLGLLGELGVQQDAVVELEQWLKASRIRGRQGPAELA